MQKISLRAIVFVFFASLLLSSCVFRKQDDLSKKKADFTMTATELFEAFEENEETANEKYIGKTIQVNGTVNQVDDKNIVLGDGMTSVNCALSIKAASEMPDISTGQEVTIKGECAGLNLFDVNLTKCVIVE